MSSPTHCQVSPNAVPAFLDEQKSLACIHCGLCLGSCPTYLETGNENDSPRGRIYLMREVQSGRLPLDSAVTRHLDLCLGCRACEAVCPSGVQYGHLLEHTRDHVERHFRRSWFQQLLRRVAIEEVFAFPERLWLALVPVRIVRWLGIEKALPKFLRDAAALVPPDATALELPEISPAAGGGNSQPRVGFVRGCVMPVLFGSTNGNSVRLLNQLGHEVCTPAGQGCCGALYAHSGQLERARECARRNIAAFEATGAAVIVINAAGCGSTLKEYGALLAEDPAWAARAAAFSSKVRDISEVLAPRLAHLGAAHRGDTGKVTYHDACHLAHAQRITREPRLLVRQIAGARYVEMPEADVCCGSAGTYNLTEPAMAERLQERKVQNILKTGATTVVSSNPGCLLQIRAGLVAVGADHIRVMHLADFIVESTSSDKSSAAGG